jgi:hypothetical protein
MSTDWYFCFWPLRLSRVKDMKRKTSLLLTVGFLAAIAPPIFAQDLQSQPGPVPPLSVIGPQLIAWSQLQKPQPIPEPVPEPDRDKKQSNQKPEPTTSRTPQQNEARSAAGDENQAQK